MKNNNIFPGISVYVVKDFSRFYQMQYITILLYIVRNAKKK